jgi:RluA family pseudouridine synthase
VSDSIKISSPATHEFWEIPVLFEDAHLLALNKPPLLLTSADRHNPERPNLMSLVHAGIAQGKPWARERGLGYLANAHRLDFETSGVLLLARSKPVLVALANLFGSDKLHKLYVALVHGSPPEKRFAVDAKVGPHPVTPGLMRVDPKHGKRSNTQFEVAERFDGCTLLTCRPLTERSHQVRVHSKHAGHPIVGDTLYGGQPLLLSRLKRSYRLKHDRTERPLISQAALHAEQFELAHPVTGDTVTLTAPWPKDLTVALKYLRRYAVTGSEGVKD